MVREPVYTPWVEQRRNLALDPRATAYTDSTDKVGWQPRWFGPGGGAGTNSLITNAADGPLGISTYARKTWTASPSGNGDTGFQHSRGDSSGASYTPGHGMAVTGEETYTFLSFLRTSSASSKPARIEAYWRDSSGAYISASASPLIELSGQGWVLLALTATAPSNATRVGFHSDVDGGVLWLPGETLDGTGLYVGAPDEYFDGSTNPDGELERTRWLGAVNASASVVETREVAGWRTAPDGAGLQARVRLAGPDGSKGRVLETLEVSASIIDSTANTLNATVTEALPDECVMLYEVATDGGWHSPRNGLFLMQSSDRDGLDVSGARSFTGTNWFASLARHAFAKPVPAGPVREPAGERVFRNPGDAVRTLIDEARAEGWGPAVLIDFDHLHDSDGAPWVDAEDGPVTVRVWQSLAETLKGIADQGLARWWTEGTTLKMLRPGVGEDRTGTVKLRSGTRLPIKTDASDICTDLHVLWGEDGKHVHVPNPGADTSFGKRWGTLTFSDVRSESEAVKLAQSYLDELRAPLVQVGFEYEGAIDFIPWADFEIGDTVLARVGDGWEPRTVVGVTATTGSSTKVRVTVGDLIISKNARRAEKVGKLVLGSIVGGPVALPSTNPRTSTIPAEPVNVRVVSNVGRWVDGFPVGTVTLDWDEVTSANDGTSLEVVGYEVWAATSTTPWHRVFGTVETGAVLEWTYGEARDLRVIAQSASGEWSAPSEVVSVTPEPPVQDTTVLDAPVLQSESGVVLVFAPATGIPEGFQFVTTQWRLDGDEEWITLAGQGDLSGQLAVIKAPAGQIIDVRLLWRDTAGRTSAPSPVAQVVVASVMEDIGPGAVTFDKLAAEEIWASEAWLDILRAGLIEVEMLHPGVGGLLDISANEAVQVAVGRLDGVDETLSQFAQVVLFEADGTAWTSPGSPVSLKVSNEGVSIRREGRVLTQWTETEMQVQALRAEQTFIGDTVLSARPGGGFTWTHI